MTPAIVASIYAGIPLLAPGAHFVAAKSLLAMGGLFFSGMATFALTRGTIPNPHHELSGEQKEEAHKADQLVSPRPGEASSRQTIEHHYHNPLFISAKEVQQEQEEAAMRAELRPLQAEMHQETERLANRLPSLAGLQGCWDDFTEMARTSLSRPFLAIAQELEERWGVGREDRSPAQNRFRGAVADFKAKYPGHDTSSLDRLYGLYIDALQSVQKSLGWEWLKSYHAEVGEGEFKQQLSQGLLSRALSGEMF